MRRELDTHPPSSLFGRFYFQAMDAGEYNYAIAFQERIKISEEKMEFYEVCDGREDLHSNQGAQRSTDVSRTSRDMCTPVYMHMWWRCVDRLSHVVTRIYAPQEMAEMYVGDDVSPDFYGWVFPKYDHVGVGTGTVVNRPAIKDYQVIVRDGAQRSLQNPLQRGPWSCVDFPRSLYIIWSYLFGHGCTQL